MVFRKLCIFALWMKVDSALEGLTDASTGKYRAEEVDQLLMLILQAEIFILPVQPPELSVPQLRKSGTVSIAITAYNLSCSPFFLVLNSC